MGVLLAIVKFIGIALLILLALLLLLLLMVLFVPVRYQAEVSCYDKQLTVRARVSYLLKLLRLNAGYSTSQPVYYSVKLLCFTLFADEESAKKAVRKTQKAEKKAVKAVKKVNQDLDKDAELTKQKSPPPSYMEAYDEEDDLYEDDWYEDIYESSKPVPKKAKSFSKGTHSGKAKKPKKKFSIRGFWESLKTKWKAFIAKLKACYQRFMEVKEKGRLFKKLYDSEVTKRAFGKVKKQVFYLLRHLKPRVVKGFIHYGFDDPAVTGEVLAGISMFYPVAAPHFEIVPDFNDACLEGEVIIKGHIRLVHVAIAAITLFFDGAIKKTIKRFKRITGGNE